MPVIDNQLHHEISIIDNILQGARVSGDESHTNSVTPITFIKPPLTLLPAFAIFRILLTLHL